MYKFKLFFLACSIFSVALLHARPQEDDNKISSKKTKVLILGTFHFAYPNLDRVKTEKKDQIDLTTDERQNEIEKLVQKLAEFKPTKIAIESKTWTQLKNDSLYNKYREDKFTLPINESYQLGFRLAKLMGHSKVYCIDTWGNISEYFSGDNKTIFNIRKERVALLGKIESYSDSLLKSKQENELSQVSKKDYNSISLQNILYEINEPEKIKRDHSHYLDGLFLFEEKEKDYAGVDWISASWFDRNLRIFRNIQRITDGPEDRILVIYGSGHLYLLTTLLEGSLNYEVVPVLDFLK